jgi:magnesium transporter
MFAQLLGPEIEALINERRFGELKEFLKELAPPDAAELIAELPDDDQKVLIFRFLPHELAHRTFEYLEHPDQEKLIEGMAREQVAHILNEMSPDDRTALLEELPPATVTEMLKLLTPEKLKVAQTLLNYPEHSVGRLMTPDFIAVHDDWTAADVLAYIREHGKKQETINVIYVVAEHRKLVDDIRIADILLRPLHTKISEIRDNKYVALCVNDSESTAVDLFRKYDRTALPVVDLENHLVGIVTVDDVLDVLEQEATSEMQKVGGSEALDEPYTTISFSRMVQKRATWLVMLFLGEMLTATAMGYFESEIEKAVVLALFLPLIISSGGNSGSQASTLIIRAMAVGEVSLTDWFRVMRREIMAGLTLGAILGTIGFIRIALWAQFSDVYGPHWFLVAVTVGVALVGVVLWGSLSGSMLPFLLRRLKVDPANSSAPFVATLVDVTGLIIYFMIALLVLRGSLLAPTNGDVVKLGEEKTHKAMDTLLVLDKNWETKDADLIKSQRKVEINLTETDDMLDSVTCEKCGGHVKVVGHNAAQRFAYTNLFAWKSELLVEMPKLICKKCGAPAEPPLPNALKQATPINAKAVAVLQSQ